MPDHIHCLFLQNPQKSIIDAIKQIKGGSSHAINLQNISTEKFAWQTGYAAYSVSGFSLASGLEKRKVISDLFEFSYGLNLIISGGWNKETTDNPNIEPSRRDTKGYFISPGIGLNLGAIMKINQNFYLGAEILPQIIYEYQDIPRSSSGGHKTKFFSAKLNSQNATLALIYRFK